MRTNVYNSMSQCQTTMGELFQRVHYLSQENKELKRQKQTLEWQVDDLQRQIGESYAAGSDNWWSENELQHRVSELETQLQEIELSYMSYIQLQTQLQQPQSWNGSPHSYASSYSVSGSFWRSRQNKWQAVKEEVEDQAEEDNSRVAMPTAAPPAEPQDKPYQTVAELPTFFQREVLGLDVEEIPEMDPDAASSEEEEEGVVRASDAHFVVSPPGLKESDLQKTVSYASLFQGQASKPAAAVTPVVEARTMSEDSNEEWGVAYWHKRLEECCREHKVEARTMDWFLQQEFSQYWEALVHKCGELTRRIDGVRVKNPSAWLTKFFNIIRADPEEPRPRPDLRKRQ